ncbi:hypothetical protein [Methyloraptor flagellatus]|uniref:TNase-like domain-containing protein n=1 Tax=Methyloraptor flagellatus TaxID=3162530 RepID=A0AAU7XCX1_9HYPH
MRKVSTTLIVAVLLGFTSFPALAIDDAPRVSQAPPAPSASRPDANGRAPIWVPVPRKIDRDNQPLQRAEPAVEGPQGEVLEPPVTVLANGDLRSGTTILRLDGIEPIDLSRLCTDDAGRRWACALRARGALVLAIQGRQLRCILSERTDTPRPAACTIAGRPLALDLIRQGWLTPTVTAPQDWIDAATRARAARLGLWSAAAP